MPWPSRGHALWRERVDAYVDGELDARATVRLEEHLGGCKSCREMLEARREVKRLAATLPEMPAPRSFKLTPGMLVEERAAPASRRGATIVMRLGQVTAGIAVVAFGAVLVAHLSSGGDDGGQQAAGAEMQTMSVQDAAGQSPSTNDKQSSVPEAQPTPGVPEFGGGTVGGASNPPAASPSPAGNDDMQQVPATGDREGEGSNAIGSPEQLNGGTQRTAEESDSDRGFLAAEAALGALIVVALTAWMVARRRRRI